MKSAVQYCDPLHKQGNDLVLLNTAVDGVSCEYFFYRWKISILIEGKYNIIGLVDTNHNTKKYLYQIFGESWVTVMGQYFLDPYILKLAGVPQELRRIQCYASDLLVLRLASGVTLEKVNILGNINLGSKSVLSTTLYFTRLQLFRVNAKVLGFKERVMYSW